MSIREMHLSIQYARIRKIIVLAATAGAALVGAEVLAAVKRFEPDQFLSVAEESGPADSRLFELARLSVALCPERLRWTFGPMPYLVSPAPYKYEALEQTRQIVLKAFGAQPGELVLLAALPSTPFAAAGLGRGDRIGPVISAKPSEMSAPAASPADSNLSATEKAERAEQARLAHNQKFSRDPIQRRLVYRGEQRMEVDIEFVPWCPVNLEVLNSDYKYAHAQWSTVQITRPLLKQLDDAGLTMVLAHETAQILSGFTELNRVNRTANVLGALLIGSGGAANSELRKSGPDEDSLIQIDRLTAMLIDVYGLTPQDFKQFLERRLGEKESWARPSYVSTRTVTPKRLRALDELTELRRKGEAWPRPEYVPEGLMDAFQDGLARSKQQRSAK